MEEKTDVSVKTRFSEKIETWKEALTRVSNLKGKDAKGRLETEFIEELVKDVYHRLGVPLRTPLPLLIGMDDNIKSITSWLTDGSLYTTDILTVLGIGGIGKTSLARYVYGLHYHGFERSSFIEDISRRCAQLNGLLYVQKQLSDEISKTSSIQVYDVSSYTLAIENALTQKKVLLVLDDIDSFQQLDALLGKKGLHLGSKIIITTKDASLIERSILHKTTVKPKHTKHLLEDLHKIADRFILFTSFHSLF